MTTWGYQQAYPLAMLDEVGDHMLDDVAIDDARQAAKRSGVDLQGEPHVKRFAIAYVSTKGTSVPISTIVNQDEATHRGYLISWSDRDLS